jgi:hypothetical protein
MKKKPESTFLPTPYFHGRLPLKAMCHVQAFQPFEMVISKTQPLKLPHYQCNCSSAPILYSFTLPCELLFTPP